LIFNRIFNNYIVKFANYTQKEKIMGKQVHLVLLTLLMVVSLGFTSCENDVDLNSEYKEITIVYGLLSQSQDRQYIKITKAFQTEGNVYVAAKDPANSVYDPKDLEVSLDEYKNDNYISSIYLDSTLITNKDTGDFYSPNEIIYVTPVGYKLNQNNEYRLIIKNKATGNIITSKTTLVHDFSILRPLALLKYANFEGNYNQKVEWTPAENGALNQFVIRFYYTDVPQSGPTSSHYVDMVFPTKRAEKNSSMPMVIEFPGYSFYQNLKTKIPLPENGMKRYSDSLYYMFDVADDDFSIYMDINGPSNSVVQERPTYSNITNGVGLFASRYSKIRYFSGLGIKSLQELYTGQYTYQLGFVDRP
jgi:hypothetical protein